MTPVASLPAAGRELDALIAERVFGLVRCQGEKHDRDYPNTFCYAQPESPTQGAEARGYSTEIASAWEVVEKMRSDPRPRFRNLSMTAYCYNRTYATFDAEAITEYTPESWAEANGEHATPLAICLAALKAVAP